MSATAEEYRMRIGALLNRIAGVSKKRPCRDCRKTIWFIKNQSGATEPISADGLNHWEECPRGYARYRGGERDDE